MKKVNIAERVRAIKEGVSDVRDRILSALDSIRDKQDTYQKELRLSQDEHRKEIRESQEKLQKELREAQSIHQRDLAELIERRLEDATGKLTGVADLIGEIPSTIERLDQRLNLINRMVSNHHINIMTRLGAGSEDEKSKILPAYNIDFDILPLLPQRPMINVLEIGAMLQATTNTMSRNGCTPLHDAGICRLTCIQPDTQACRQMQQLYPRDKFIAKCAGTGETRLFYNTMDPEFSSLYEPDKHLAACYEDLSDRMLLEHMEDIETVKLDDVPELKDVDFIKAQAQGGELEILQGAAKCLESAVVVECTVAFVTLYKNQPMFADVDTFMRSKGFHFHRFNNLTGRMRQELPTELVVQTPTSQVLWGNAVYVRSMCDLEKLPKLKLLKLAVIMHMVYESHDLALAALATYDKSFNTRLGPAYTKSLMRAVIAS